MNKIEKLKIFRIIFIGFFFLASPLFAQSGKQLEKVVSAIEAGLFQEALNLLDKAQLKEPNNAELYKLKALLLEATNNNSKAIIAWNNCIKNTKNNDLINEAKIHLENLKDN